MAKMLQINVPIEFFPPEDVIQAASVLFARVSEHKQKKLWGRVSVEVLMENGVPSKVTVNTSEVYSERDMAAKKLRVDP